MVEASSEIMKIIKETSKNPFGISISNLLASLDVNNGKQLSQGEHILFEMRLDEAARKVKKGDDVNIKKFVTNRVPHPHHYMFWRVLDHGRKVTNSKSYYEFLEKLSLY